MRGEDGVGFMYGLVLVSCIPKFSLLRSLFETIPVGGGVGVGVGKQVIIMLTQPQLCWARA